MENIIKKTLLAGLFLIPVLTFAQGNVQLSLKKDSVNVKRSTDFLAIDITKDLWLEDRDLVEQRIWSPGITISLFKDIRFGKSSFSFAPGLGFSSHNVHSNGTFQEMAATDTSSSYTRLVPLTNEYDKNKLSTNYLEIPLELRFISKKRRPFRVHTGFKAGYLVNVHTKTKDEFGKRKFFDIPNINDLRYGVYSRIGWNYISLYGFYSLSTLLEEGKGDEIIPVSLGISITL